MKELRAVIVDDHADFRKLARACLTAYGEVQVVGEAQDGVEAVHLCESTRPDLVLLDLNMPRMGGLQALPLIKAQDDAPYVAIISLFEDEAHRICAQRFGADKLLDKSNFMGEIVNLLDDLVEAHLLTYLKSA